MSELPITPFAAVPGLESLGDEAAGFCADGVCAVPEPTEPGTGGSPEPGTSPEAAGSRESR